MAAGLSDRRPVTLVVDVPGRAAGVPGAGAGVEVREGTTFPPSGGTGDRRVLGVASLEPATAWTDLRRLGPEALLVVRAGRASTSWLHTVARQLADLDILVVGVVVVHPDPRDRSDGTLWDGLHLALRGRATSTDRPLPLRPAPSVHTNAAGVATVRPATIPWPTQPAWPTAHTGTPPTAELQHVAGSVLVETIEATGSTRTEIGQSLVAEPEHAEAPEPRESHEVVDATESADAPDVPADCSSEDAAAEDQLAQTQDSDAQGGAGPGTSADGEDVSTDDVVPVAVRRIDPVGSGLTGTPPAGVPVGHASVNGASSSGPTSSVPDDDTSHAGRVSVDKRRRTRPSLRGLRNGDRPAVSDQHHPVTHPKPVKEGEKS
jgi:hypothetical protein